MRIMYGLDTIEFISWRSVDVRIRFMLVGEFVFDAYHDNAKTKLELS